jgi:hypothetical protein
MGNGFGERRIAELDNCDLTPPKLSVKSAFLGQLSGNASAKSSTSNWPGAGVGDRCFKEAVQRCGLSIAVIQCESLPVSIDDSSGAQPVAREYQLCGSPTANRIADRLLFLNQNFSD